MPYEEHYTDAELGKVIEQAAIYMCACPAQLAESIRRLRELLRYQQRCMEVSDVGRETHLLIAESTIQAHGLMQDCLDKVIAIEKWDRSTLEMPAELRKRQFQEL